MKVKQYSPFVINFEIVAKGNMKRKAKLSNIWNEIQPQHMFTAPIINKKDQKKQKQKETMKSSVEYDVKGIVH